MSNNGDIKKIHSDELDGEIKSKLKSNTAWKIEHAGCHVVIAHAENQDKTKFTLFACSKHNATHIIKGIHLRMPG